jgi:hypothetical protein
VSAAISALTTRGSTAAGRGGAQLALATGTCDQAGGGTDAVRLGGREAVLGLQLAGFERPPAAIGEPQLNQARAAAAGELDDLADIARLG